jgi:ribose transport system permease protein
MRSAERVALPFVWLVLIIAFSIVLPTTFFSAGNLSSILSSSAVIVVLTLGILIPLTAGDFDVSIAFNLVLSSMLIALLNT